MLSFPSIFPALLISPLPKQNDLYFCPNRFIFSCPLSGVQEIATQEWEPQLLTPAFIFCFSEARVCMFVSSRETELLDCESLWVKSVGCCTLLAQIESFRTESLSLCTHANGDVWWFPRKHAPIWPGREKSLHRSPLVGFILAVPAALRWHSADTCLCFLKHLLKGAKPLNLAPGSEEGFYLVSARFFWGINLLQDWPVFNFIADF